MHNTSLTLIKGTTGITDKCKLYFKLYEDTPDALFPSVQLDLGSLSLTSLVYFKLQVRLWEKFAESSITTEVKAALKCHFVFVYFLYQTAMHTPNTHKSAVFRNYDIVYRKHLHHTNIYLDWGVTGRWAYIYPHQFKGQLAFKLMRAVTFLLDSAGPCEGIDMVFRRQENYMNQNIDNVNASLFCFRVSKGEHRSCGACKIYIYIYAPPDKN